MRREAAAAARTLIVKNTVNAAMLVTMDDARREIRDGGLFVAHNRVVVGGPTAVPPNW